jgi:hypothetical protein
MRLPEGMIACEHDADACLDDHDGTTGAGTSHAFPVAGMPAASCKNSRRG